MRNARSQKFICTHSLEANGRCISPKQRGQPKKMREVKEPPGGCLYCQGPNRNGTLKGLHLREVMQGLFTEVWAGLRETVKNGETAGD